MWNFFNKTQIVTGTRFLYQLWDFIFHKSIKLPVQYGYYILDYVSFLYMHLSTSVYLQIHFYFIMHSISCIFFPYCLFLADKNAGFWQSAVMCLLFITIFLKWITAKYCFKCTQIINLWVHHELVSYPCLIWAHFLGSFKSSLDC